jgi:hypothetical protein
MNSTEKAEMQVDELDDGGAAVMLPEGEENPQDRSAESAQDHDDDHDDEPTGRKGDDVDPEREEIRAARREERRLKKQIHREKAKESNYLINALKKQNSELADRLASVERKTNGAELARVDKAIEDALNFMNNSGLAELFKGKRISNLVDYMIGVEAGLDSNGRKNRSGTGMESVVEAYLTNFVKRKKLEFIRQATPIKIKAKWGFSVPVDKSSRAFDFAISDGSQLVLMEVNFYGGGGSKLKATAGEYKGLFDLLNIPKVQFVWVTDGEGWKTTKLPLKSAYEHIDYIWNLNWLARGYLDDLFD